MDRQLQSYLGQIQIGEAQTYKNLTAYPVLFNQMSALDYITLDEALSQGLIEIAEIDKNGSVPKNKTGPESLPVDLPGPAIASGHRRCKLSIP